MTGAQFEYLLLIGQGSNKQSLMLVTSHVRSALCTLWFILFLFVCWNLFCTIANLRIKSVTETKKMSVLLYTNLRSSFLHDSHNWLWVFFTLLVALAHRATLLALFKLLFYVQTSMSNFFQLKINRKVLS